MQSLRRWAAAVLCGLLCSPLPAAAVAEDAAGPTASDTRLRATMFFKMLDFDGDGFLSAAEVEDKVLKLLEMYIGVRVDDA